MKKITITILSAFAFVALVTVSCNKDIKSTEVLKPLTPTSLDENAGTWKMIVMTGPAQVALAAPDSVKSVNYQAELAAIKKLQAGLTDAQRASIAYWSGGGVLRWNEIMRELVARYNLPPAPNADGSYPVPDAEILLPIRLFRFRIQVTQHGHTAMYRPRNMMQ